MTELSGEPLSAGSGLSASGRRDENFAALFGPDPLVEPEFLRTVRRMSPLQAEGKLMHAILQDAIECFQRNLLGRDSKSSRLFNDATAWILSSDSDWIFSFDNICEQLRLNPSYLRRGLMEWMDKQLAQGSESRVPRRNKLAG